MIDDDEKRAAEARMAEAARKILQGERFLNDVANDGSIEFVLLMRDPDEQRHVAIFTAVHPDKAIAMLQAALDGFIACTDEAMDKFRVRNPGGDSDPH